MVEAKGLVKHYGSFLALDHVEFDIADGTATGLLGPNGAGKSTLMKTLLGFLDFSAGSCMVMGHSPARAPMEVRRSVGFMPENEAFFPVATGIEAVVMAGRLSGMPREAAFSRAYEVLDYLGMDEVRHRPVSGYSVGLKQKIKLAQALIHGPRFLFLDEPLSGLDPNSRDEMMSLLQGIARAGVAMVVSSHVLRDVEALCSEILMLDRGKLLYSGSLEKLKKQQSGRFFVRIRGDIELFKENLRKRGAEIEEERVGVTVVLPPGQSTSLIWEAAGQSGYQIRELRLASDSLEKAFLRLLGRED